MTLNIILSSESFAAFRIETNEFMVRGVGTSDVGCHGCIRDIRLACSATFDGAVVDVGTCVVGI